MGLFYTAPEPTRGNIAEDACKLLVTYHSNLHVFKVSYPDSGFIVVVVFVCCRFILFVFVVVIIKT